MDSSAARWRISVSGIHSSAAYRWIQVTLVGEPALAFTVQIARESSASQALEGIARQLQKNGFSACAVGVRAAPQSENWL